MFPSSTIASICHRITSGGTPSRTNPNFFSEGDEGHLWVKSKELLDRPIKETEERISDLGLKKSSAKYLPRHTILIAMYGANVGQLGWLCKQATVNQAICGLVVDETKANYRYVFYSLLATRERLSAKAHGAAQQNLNQDLIKEFDIPLPELPIQKRIASILSAYDDLIENNIQRIQILEEMARRVYEKWFMHFHFPGYENVKLIESEVGLIPESWSVKTLDKAATINRLSVRRGKEPNEILYVDIASVSTGKIDNIQAMSFDEAPGRARRIVGHGDIIWSNVRPNRKSYALVINPPQNMIVSTGFTVVSAVSVPYSFLYQALTTEDFASYLTNRAKGAAYPAVGSEDFANAKVIIPTAKLLDSFHEMTEPMQLEKNLLLRKNEILRRTRDLLLPNLISGDVDVSHFDEPLSD